MAVAVENRSSRRTQISERVLSVAIGTALHPLRYVKVLVQLGNDPYPIYRSKAYIFFGPYRYFLPNGIQYSSLGRYIYQKDGFLGLYNGLGASISGYLVSSLVSSRVAQYLNEQYPDEPPKANESDAEAFGRHVKKVIKDTLSKCAGTVAARPFQEMLVRSYILCYGLLRFLLILSIAVSVAMIRSMAQFIGGERMYLGLILSLKSIYDQTGIKGYF
ncbi:unnamed protein product [Soboliphyme baturini]|uniref:ADP,ATP carrier protein n=1 Tax=Soboliphyme baturini TaxID=241478 RepID=A0A183IUH1_9BILA|nr:unnamed protein product [Soboliphyme baturini]